MPVRTSVVLCAAINALLMAFGGIAAAEESQSPKIDTLKLENAQFVCVAWPQGVSWQEARSSGISWVGLPAAVKPFGMRGYVGIDGIVHPLHQIAYAHPDGTVSIYYRTLGDRHYDIYLNLSGLVPGELKGKNLTGTLVVSRFGLFSEIKIAGSCGQVLQ